MKEKILDILYDHSTNIYLPTNKLKVIREDHFEEVAEAILEIMIYDE